MTTNEKPRILVVDDDPNFQKLVGIYLRGNYETDFAVSVFDAQQKLKKHDVAAVLLDLTLLGDEDGLNLVRHMRSNGFATTPVIAQTAHDQDKYRETCLDAGCNNYIPKPYKRSDLLEIIQKEIDSVRRA